LQSPLPLLLILFKNKGYNNQRKFLIRINIRKKSTISIHILEKLKIPETEMEKFLETMYGSSQKMDLKPDILKDALLQFVKLSDESPFLDVPKYLHEKNEEIE
jgi:hypothetical protein